MITEEKAELDAAIKDLLPPVEQSEKTLKQNKAIRGSVAELRPTAS